MKSKSLGRLLAGAACGLLAAATALAQPNPPQYVYTVVAATGDPLAGQAGTIRSLECPAINDTGAVAFLAGRSGQSPALVVSQDSVHQVRFFGGQSIGPFTIDASDVISCPSLNNAGQLAFAAFTAPGRVGTILSGPPDRIVARELGLQADPPSMGAAGWTFYRQGAAIFAQVCADPGCPPRYEVPAAPGQTGIGGVPDGDRDGRRVVHRVVLGGEDGIALADRLSPAPPVVLYRTGAEVDGRVVNLFGDPVISGQWIAFRVRLQGGGMAVVRGDVNGGPLKLIAQDAAAFSSSAYFQLVGVPGVSANGTVVFHARVNDEARENGLFTGPSLRSDTVVREGMSLLGLGPRPVETVWSDRLQESIDSAGNVVFRATFMDGMQAVVRAALRDHAPDLIVGGGRPEFAPRTIRTPLLYDGATGAFVRTFSATCFVQDMTFGPDGRFYVLDIPSPRELGLCDTGDRMRRFIGATGQFDPVDDEFASYVPAGAYPGGFPNAFAFGPDGNLYVADGDENGRFPGTVYKFGGPLSDQPGAYLGVFVAPGADGLSDPRRLRFGPDGDLYVASYRTNQVLRYDGADGAFLGAVAGPHSGLNGPVDLVFGPSGALYVLSANDDSVRVYDGTVGHTFIAALGIQAHSMAFGPNGDLFVSGGTPRQTGVFRYDGRTGAARGLFATVLEPVGPLLFSTRPAGHPDLGDFDGNGCVDRQDLDLLTGQIGRPFPDLRFDLTGEGSVTVADARKLVLLFSRPQGAACE